MVTDMIQVTRTYEQNLDNKGIPLMPTEIARRAFVIGNHGFTMNESDTTSRNMLLQNGYQLQCMVSLGTLYPFPDDQTTAFTQVIETWVKHEESEGMKPA